MNIRKHPPSRAPEPPESGPSAELLEQLTAHLDRGWDLAQRGEAEGAELSARRALELDAQSPEAHNLLGYALSLAGQFDDALEAYQQALSIDDTFFEAMLNAAELCLHPLASPELALRQVEDALEVAETDDERADALLLRFEALYLLGKRSEARATLAKIPEGPKENPAHSFLIGRAWFELGEKEKAEQHLRDASQRDPQNPEAPYFLGLLLDERGEVHAATESFLISRELELSWPAPPFRLSREAFQAEIRRVAQTITPRLRAYIDLDELYAGDLPGVEAIVDGIDPRTPVLVDSLDSESPHFRIFVYQLNIERSAGSVELYAEEIRSALERELAGALLGDDLESPPDGTPLN